MIELGELYGLDLYLLDQLLRGHIPDGAAILDAGCGGGRNVGYFLRHGYDVSGVDRDEAAIHAVREGAERAGIADAGARFLVERIEKTSFAARQFDLVIANAVLHFAEDEQQFGAMVTELHRVLRPGGLCFARLASDIGIETLLRPPACGRGSRWRALPDGSDRFVVDLAFLLDWTTRLGARLVDPIKTVNVQNLRCMTTWVWRRTEG